MMDWQDFELEKKILGEKAHRRLKELENQVWVAAGCLLPPIVQESQGRVHGERCLSLTSSVSRWRPTQIHDLQEKNKTSLATEIKTLIQKEWRPLRDTRVEEDLRENELKDQARYNCE